MFYSWSDESIKHPTWKKVITNNKLAANAIYFEQKIMNEIVGSQDQIAASIGGFNKIIFKKKDKFVIKKIKEKKNIKKLEKNLILIYTGINRSAHRNSINLCI